MRRLWLTILLVSVGCQSMGDRPARLPPPAKLPMMEPPMPQTELQLEQDTIKQARDLAEHKKESEACALLADFLSKHRERCEAHLAYALLLLQTKQFETAKVEFGEFLERCKDTRPERIRMLIEAHDGLAQIATATRDEYGTHLHHGIGLYYMTQSNNGVQVGGIVFPNIKLLDDSLKELSKAHDLGADEARPCWYLSCVYRALGEKEQADQFLRQAEQRAGLSRLTPLERHDLELAVRSKRVDNTYQH